MRFRNVFLPLKIWWRDQRALAATEFALIFPILFMMLLGTVELGNGIMANQKTIMASQVVSDLITRSEAVTAAQLSEAKAAGRLALDPFDADLVVDVPAARGDMDDPRPFAGNDVGTPFGVPAAIDDAMGLGARFHKRPVVGT